MYRYVYIYMYIQYMYRDHLSNFWGASVSDIVLFSHILFYNGEVGSQEIDLPRSSADPSKDPS